MKKFYPVLLAFMFLIGCSSSEEKLVKQADRLHRDILSVDTHCDTPMRLMEENFDLGVRNDKGCVDFPRMKEGGLDAEFFAVFIGQGPRNDSTFEKVHKEALDILEAIYKNVEKNSSMAEIALSPDDAYRLKRNGKIAAFIGIENGYPIGRKDVR